VPPEAEITKAPEPGGPGEQAKANPKNDVDDEPQARLPIIREGAKKLPAAVKPVPPLTRAAVGQLGDRYLGRRVTWVAQRAITQSAKIGSKDGTQHILKGQDTNGEFTLALAILAEEPKPFQSKFKKRTPEEMRRDLEEFQKFKKDTGLTGRDAVLAHGKLKIDTVTVTGTIARTETLIVIGQGTHHDVPVLTDIVIVSNRNR
jgi:hypothetical protein